MTKEEELKENGEILRNLLRQNFDEKTTNVLNRIYADNTDRYNDIQDKKRGLKVR